MTYDVLCVSPHLDDAVLSCGGWIYRLTAGGKAVLVVTAMTADEPTELSPIAADLHRQWGLEQVFAGRRREDEAACAALGCDVLHLGVDDAIYRRGKEGEPLYPSYRALFDGRPHHHDDVLVAELARRFAELPAAARVLVPLTIGGHVDHVINRRAAERAFDRAALEYYEDYPYAHKRRAVWKVLGWPLLRRGWRSRLESLDADALEAKCRSIACYDSQIENLFQGDAEVMRRHVGRYTRRLGGERFWRPDTE